MSAKYSRSAAVKLMPTMAEKELPRNQSFRGFAANSSKALDFARSLVPPWYTTYSTPSPSKYRLATSRLDRKFDRKTVFPSPDRFKLCLRIYGVFQFDKTSRMRVG